MTTERLAEIRKLLDGCNTYDDLGAHVAQELLTAFDEAKGVLGLTQDEYVKQVGTWKIIQRLEEENDRLRKALTRYKGIPIPHGADQVDMLFADEALKGN